MMKKNVLIIFLIICSLINTYTLDIIKAKRSYINYIFTQQDTNKMDFELYNKSYYSIVEHPNPNILSIITYKQNKLYEKNVWKLINDDKLILKDMLLYYIDEKTNDQIEIKTNKLKNNYFDWEIKTKVFFENGSRLDNLQVSFKLLDIIDENIIYNDQKINCIKFNFVQTYSFYIDGKKIERTESVSKYFIEKYGIVKSVYFEKNSHNEEIYSDKVLEKYLQDQKNKK